MQPAKKSDMTVRSSRWPWISAIAVGLAGIAITLWLWQARTKAIAQTAENEFRAQAEDLQSAVVQEVQLFMEVLASIRQLHSISDQISTEDFDEFVEKGMLFQKRALGGFGLAQRTDDYARNLLEQEKLGPTIVELSETFEYVPAGKRDEYFSLTYQTPEDALRVPLGFDFNSSEPCKLAVDYMMKSGEFALGGEEPDAEGQTDADYFMFAPILYPTVRGIPVPPPGYVIGFAIGVLRPDTIIEHISERPGAQQLVISLSPPRSRRDDTSHLAVSTDSRFTYEQPITIANETWRFRCVASEEYIAAHRTKQPAQILATGLIITALLTLELLLMAKRARNTERIVQVRTAALQEAKQLLEQGIAERMRLESEILDISTREKLRVGQNLHDSLGQKLTGAVFLSRALSKRLPDDAENARSDAEQVTDLLKDALGQVRRIARGLAPVELSDEGLVNALRRLAEETQETYGAHCVVTENGEPRISKAKTAVHLYHIAQEAVSNAVRHGKATQVSINLAADNGDGGYLAIEDNGNGLPRDAEEGAGMGLKIMRYRAAMIGGTLVTKKAESGGTVITCRFPVVES